MLPLWMVVWFEPPLPPHHPSGNSSFTSYFPLKNLAFKMPLPFGISNGHPWGRFKYFLETHILNTYIVLLLGEIHFCRWFRV